MRYKQDGQTIFFLPAHKIVAEALASVSSMDMETRLRRMVGYRWNDAIL